jgi:predicted methyltransferase
LNRCIRAGALAVAVALAVSVAAPGGHAHRFDDPQRWAKTFDDPARDKWQKPDEVIKALALEPGQLVADIGAGTGYFTVRLARAVPTGLVFAVDVEPKMARYIAERARKEKLANVRTVVGGEEAANLPQPVDRVLVVNTYHHIDARPTYFRALRDSLKPGARVAIIDHRLDAPRGAPKHMRLPPEKIAAEMEEAGYRLVEAFEFLPYQSYQVFSVARP